MNSQSPNSILGSKNKVTKKNKLSPKKSPKRSLQNISEKVLFETAGNKVISYVNESQPYNLTMAKQVRVAQLVACQLADLSFNPDRGKLVTQSKSKMQ